MHSLVLVFSWLIGTLAGSFANVVISRGSRRWGFVKSEELPSGFAFPPSQCEACGRALLPFELVPVLSFFVLKGRCRTCGARIGLRHIIVELLGGAAALVIVSLAPHGLDIGFSAGLAFFLLILAGIDAETSYLPDRLTLPLLALGLLYANVGGPLSLPESALGALIGGGSLWLLAFLYRRLRGAEGLGGGDVKLMAAAGAWCGPYSLPFILLAASLGGIAYALPSLIRNNRQDALATEVRFGPFLAAAIFAVFILGPEVLPP
ncbi:MAG: A24 family peptidase [Pseudomonadota bacterium]